MVHIEVTDTGPGISPEDQLLLFKPFERLSSSASDLDGTGIGLSLTRHVVEAMNGRIGVESVVGEGSTFWVDLPATDPTPADGQGDDVRAGDEDQSAAEPGTSRQVH
jgi:signal transduction histidine kinase